MSFLRLSAAVLLSILVVSHAFAGAELVKQIGLTSLPGSSTPYLLQQRGNEVLFRARDADAGWRLWKSDGTSVGTVPIVDPCPGPTFAISQITVVGNTIWMAANDDVHGFELWKSDGTQAGTSMVKDANPGSDGSDIWWIADGGAYVYFLGETASDTFALWRSDGTADGTQLLEEFPRQNAYRQPWPIGPVAAGFLFYADDGVNGYELWISNGTEAGTQLVEDVAPGAARSYVNDTFARVGSSVYLALTDPDHGTELWKSDGTAAGTFLIKDILPGSGSGFNGGQRLISAAGNTVLFDASDGLSWPTRLWKTDGTEAGTVEVAAVSPREIVQWGSQAAFLRWIPQTNGSELWKTDGTSAGTQFVATVPPSVPRLLFPAGTNLFLFVAGELWVSDGSESGTKLVKTVGNTPYDLGGFVSSLGNSILFSASDPVLGDELWRSDGTTAGTTVVRDIDERPLGTGGNMVTTRGSLDNAVVFQTSDGMWRSDGSAAGTFRLGYPNAVHVMSRVGNSLFFHPSGGGLARTDGTSIFGLANAPTTESRDAFHDLGGVAYFAGSDVSAGMELWRSDGSSATRVADIRPGAGSSSPSFIAVMGGKLYFAADDGANGKELWTSNGTAAGTTLLKDIHASGSSDPRHLVAIGAYVYFFADDGTNGRELWRTDGTTAGTVLVANAIAGAGGLDVVEAIAVGATLFFRTPKELWKSGGANVELVRAFAHGFTEGTEDDAFWRYQVDFPALYAVAGKLVFFADDGVTGREPWVSDGTADGTFPLKDIHPGLGSSAGWSAAAFGGNLFFTAHDPDHGAELWKTDGTIAGTLLEADIAAGAASSIPILIPATKYELMFLASTPSLGYQLYRVTPGALDPARTTMVASPPAAAFGQPVTITVTLRDAQGDAVGASGGTVALQTTHGELSAVTDHANGTYTATLVANTSGTAFVTSTLNGEATPATATVSFSFTAGTSVTATATSPTTVLVAWTLASGATGYDVYRGNDLVGSFDGTSTIVSGLSPATTYLFSVQPRANADPGPISAPDLATTVIFTDDPLVAGATMVQQQHFTQLLTAVNSVRAAASLAPITLRDLTGATILASDVQTLRNGVSAARTALGFSTAWTDPSLASLPVRAVHVEEMRNAVK